MRPFLAILALIAPASFAADPPKPAATPATTQAAKKPENSYAKITQKEIDAIEFDDLPEDNGVVTPVAADLDNMDNDSRKRLDDWTSKLNDWAGAKEENLPQRVRNLLHVAALADLVHSEFEGETAYVIFDKLKSEVDKEVLIKACAWIVLKPNEGRAVTRVPELGWDDENDEEPLRERVMLYAKKLLGRLEGKLPKKE
jgi:hypothetical protein